MFDKQFYPTPENVIIKMMEGEEIQGKVFLEPSAGKGDIVDFLLREQAGDVIACEKHPDLRKITADKCRIIKDDFFDLNRVTISHIHCIVMNPPFLKAEKHILHAWEIAPPGCRIIALCNLETVRNTYNKSRDRLSGIIDDYGQYEDLGECFKSAERYTEVKVALIKIEKPGSYESEFDGFFLTEEEEPVGNGPEGICKYDFIRDLVGRYTEAVKIFDQQLDAAVKMNNLTGSFFKSQHAFHCTEDGKPKKRNEFKKDLQQAAWQFIFDKMNMHKYSTTALQHDLNLFIHNQHKYPFTMKNIYRMLDVIIGTQRARMEKAMVEVFDIITQHHEGNRYFLEGWKTNSHYLVAKKFILPYILSDYFTNSGMSINRNSILEDITKALCYLTGKDYLAMPGSWDLSGKSFGQWHDWGFFEIKGFKKGSMHFKFKDDKVYKMFNERVARIKGYPLPEYKETTPWQDKQHGRTSTEDQPKTTAKELELF